jgi:hypothetical protein
MRVGRGPDRTGFGSVKERIAGGRTQVRRDTARTSDAIMDCSWLVTKRVSHQALGQEINLREWRNTPCNCSEMCTKNTIMRCPLSIMAKVGILQCFTKSRQSRAAYYRYSIFTTAMCDGVFSSLEPPAANPRMGRGGTVPVAGNVGTDCSEPEYGII